MIQRIRKAQEGFTLIELVVVVAILGILAVIVTPKVLGAMDNAKKNSAMSSAKQIQVGIERYYAENGKYMDGVTLCGAAWSSSATACDKATMKTALASYVNLDTTDVTSATFTSTVTSGATTDYTLTITFKSYGTALAITPNSIQ